MASMSLKELMNNNFNCYKNFVTLFFLEKPQLLKEYYLFNFEINSTYYSFVYFVFIIIIHFALGAARRLFFPERPAHRIISEN